MVITSINPEDTETVSQEIQIPPIYVQGYPPVTSILLSKQTRRTFTDIELPINSTLAILGNMVGSLRHERSSIESEINHILKPTNPSGRSKSKAKAVPEGGV